MSDRVIRFVGLYSTLAAGASVVVAPLFALSYFATASGAEQLDTATVSAWLNWPARSREDCSPSHPPTESMRPISSCSRSSFLR